jgi:hypothetical protein
MNLSVLDSDAKRTIALALLEKQRRQRQRKVLELAWQPLPGPQSAALESSADFLFYGGAAGGGKTDLLLGAARFRHWRSIIFRRVFPSLRAIVDRSRSIYNPEGVRADKDSYNESLFRWKFGDGRQIKFGSIQYEKDVTDYQGQPHDFYGFDEITEFTERQFRFVTGWNRLSSGASRSQRCRVIATGNPPTTPEGEWIIQFWGPWLDPQYPNPAAPGELRWFTTIEGKDKEVEGGQPFEYKGETLTPKSRTFIPASIQDNPYLRDSGYIATLQGLPEPLRSKMLYGDFKAGREDTPWQVIPTEWVQAAQERWKARSKPVTPISALGVDVARGGKDKTILSPRYDNWFGEQLCYPGASTPDGPAVAALVIQALGGQKPAINVDVIGVGTSVYDCLRVSHPATMAMNGAEGSDARDKTGQLGFVNCRAEWWWKLREALEPTSGQDIALPPDRELLVDLCTPQWKLTVRGIQIEGKDDIIKRIGRSPDKGDSLVYAHAIKHMPGAGWMAFFESQAVEAQRALEKTKQP